MSRDADVAVVGAGPAGLAAAAACAEAGLATILVAPEPAQVWPNTYGCWLDELEPLGLRSVAAVTWPTVRVVGTRTRTLVRSYAVVDNARLHRHLSDRYRTRGGQTVVAAASGAEHFTWGSRLLLGHGEALDVGLIIDASGAAGRLVKGGSTPTAVQDAYGIVARFEAPPIPTGSCTLMDWSSPTGRPDDDRRPTFLYAMDLGDGRFLVEETSLAARTPLGRDELRRRLDCRLQRLGTAPSEILAEEDVLIRMGVTPPPAQPVAATGAAAGLVHPASGYSLAAGLRAAPVLADALRTATADGAEPSSLATVVWQAVWPSSRRRARRLELFGLARLLQMDAQDVRAFVDAFFGLPGQRWSSYLSGTASSVDVARTMAALFGAAPWPVRRRLIGR